MNPIMRLVEVRSIKSSNPLFKELDNLCFLSKNLYNSTLYVVRQEYISTKKYLNYYEVNKMFTESNQVDYRALPAKVAKNIQMLVDKTFKSFFNLLKSFKDIKPKIPKYLNKEGRQVVLYTEQALKKSKKGFIGLSGTDIWIETDKDIKFLRLVPRGNHINIELGYEVVPKEYTSGKVAGIDLGINNLATVVIPGEVPLILNGKPLKSINQFYNKQLAEQKSYLSKFKDSKGNSLRTSKRIQRLNFKRNNKVKDYMHKASRFITNHLVFKGVSDLVIGYNTTWKQDVKMRKDIKQTFIQIPFKKFIEMLTYKCKLVGIKVILVDESYTSKASFFDGDYVPTYGKGEFRVNFSGRRVCRGLYRIFMGLKVNADVNGALNILRKAKQEKLILGYILTQDFLESYKSPRVKVA